MPFLIKGVSMDWGLLVRRATMTIGAAFAGERDSLSDGQTYGIFLSSDNFFGIIYARRVRTLVVGQLCLGACAG